MEYKYSYRFTEKAEQDFDEILRLGFEVGAFFGEYQLVYAIHLDSDSNHTHLHFVMNTTSFRDGHKYSDGLSKFNALCRYLRERYPRFETHLFHTDYYNALNYYTKEKKGVYQMLE